MFNEEVRLPLSPIEDNSLAETPPPELELPAAFKGENVELEGSVATSRAGSTAPAEESRSPLTRLPENSSNSSGAGRPPSAELFFKGELDAELREETTTEEGSRSNSPSLAPSEGLPQAAPLDEDKEAAQAEQEVVSPLEIAVDKDAESAIHALLALQREPSPTTPRSRDSSPERLPRRPHSPNLVKGSAIQKGGGCQEVPRFFCRFPRCNKAYASTDAVRKHCRQRHLDWLRRLGHGCPALYCRWED